MAKYFKVNHDGEMIKVLFNSNNKSNTFIYVFDGIAYLLKVIPVNLFPSSKVIENVILEYEASLNE